MTTRPQTKQDPSYKPQRVSGLSLGIAMTLGCFSTPLFALEIPENHGWSGSMNVGVSVGTSIRDQSPDSKLYSGPSGIRAGLATGGTGATNTDSGNVNYGKGDAFSTLVKATLDFSMKKEDYGFFVRAKAWYDHALEEGRVNQGNGSSGYEPVSGRRSLSDNGFDPLARFSGAEILDAYAYTGFEAAGQSGQLRVGRQVINWGESLFIQGVNQVNPIDLSALRKPGTEIKDAFLPVEAVFANVGIGEGRSLEAFVQTKWSPANLDSCGTYWSPVEFQATHRAGGPCSLAITTLPGASNYAQLAAGNYIRMGQGKAGDNQEQFGLALRIPSETIDGEIGLYAMRISSRIPYISGRSGSNLRGILSQAVAGNLLTQAQANALNPQNFINPIPAQVAGAPALSLVDGTGFWEYPNDINVFGLSASTNLSGWSVGAELSHTPNQPAQINGNDLLAGILYGVGPMRAEAEAAAAAGAGTEIAGYKRLQKTQMQVNGIRVLPRILGSVQSVFVGEFAYQRANVGDRNTGKRFGRSFIYGFAPHAAYTRDASAGLGGASTAAAGIAAGSPVTNPQEDGRVNDGFATENSWGYRLRLQLEYPQVFGTSATLFPTFSFSHDVSGYSIDTQIVEGRQTIGLGLRANFNRVHNIELGYVRYADAAKYDAFRDRDYYSLVLSTSF